MPEWLRLARASQKLPAGLLAVALCALFYTVPSALTQDRAATIGLFAWERAIPFLPFTVWAYVAQYPLLVLAYFGTADLQRCTRFLHAVVLVQAAAALAFLAFPLRYPREPFLVQPGPGDLTLALLAAVQRVDAPVNCCPSLHVTSCLLCMCLVGRSRGPLAWVVAMVGTASMASTLTVKQHYAIDLLAAVPLAALGWWLAGKTADRRRSPTPEGMAPT